MTFSEFGVVLVWVRALGYMLCVGTVHFIALPWLLLTIENGTAWPIVLRSGLAGGLGALLVILGASLALLSAVHLVVHGHGTPFPLDPTRVLVRRGPYRYIRNPQAVAAAVIVVGECLLVQSRLMWLLVPATLLYLELLAAPIEDWQLRRQFRSEYLAYRQAVPRWLPRRRAKPGGGQPVPSWDSAEGRTQFIGDGSEPPHHAEDERARWLTRSRSEGVSPSSIASADRG